MLLSAHKLIGRPVKQRDNRKKLSSVKDVIFDPADQKIAAFVVSEKKLFQDTQAVPFSSLYHVAQDEVIVESRFDIKKTTEISDVVSRIADDTYYLTGCVVETNEGEKLGEVSDLFFDTRTGEVPQIEITKKSTIGRTLSREVADINNLTIRSNRIVVLPSQTKSNNENAAIGDDPSLRSIQHIVGMYLTKNILLPNDNFFAQAGELITHKMIKSALSHGVLDQVITYSTPSALSIKPQKESK